MKIIANQIDKKNSLALAKIVAIVILKLRGAKVLELKDSIADPGYKDALDFLNTYTDDTKPFRDVYRNILKKSDALEPFAQPFGNYLRQMLNSNNLKNKIDILPSQTKEVLIPAITFLSNADKEDTTSRENAFNRLHKTISALGESKLTAKYVQLYSEFAANNSTNTQATPTQKLDPKNSIRPVVQLRPVTPSVPESNTAQTLLNLEQSIHKIGKQITGQDNISIISVADKNKYREDPQKKELVKQFDKLRKQLSDVRINEVRSVITSSGKEVMTVKDVVKALKARGIKKLTIPAGLQTSNVVYLNADADYCDSEGRVAVRQGANFPGAIFIHNESYEHNAPRNNWLFKIQTPAGTNYVQTETKVALNRAARFDKIDKALESGIENVKESWRGSLSGNPEEERTVYANIAEYLFWTASRVGAREGMTDNSRTYGATNFLVKHIENLPKAKGAVPSRLIIRYPIKSGATDTFTLTSQVKNLPSKNDSQYMKLLIEFIVKKAQGKKPDDIVFTINNKRINTDKLNGFLKTVLEGFSGKDFRTLRGTDLAIYALGEAKKEFDRLVKQVKNGKVPAATVNALFDAALTSVGELLGHVRNTDDDGEKMTPNTAIKSYVKPSVCIDWYNDVGYAPPKKVLTAARMAGMDL